MVPSRKRRATTKPRADETVSQAPRVANTEAIADALQTLEVTNSDIRQLFRLTRQFAPRKLTGDHLFQMSVLLFENLHSCSVESH